MDLQEHLALSLPVAALIGGGGGDWVAAGAFLCGGVLVDLDHLPDYWRERGFGLSLAKMNAHFGGRGAKHNLLILHGWEWNGLLWAAWAGLALPAWVAALAAGWLAHLALDQRFNLLQPWAYWFFARFDNGFRTNKLYLHDHP